LVSGVNEIESVKAVISVVIDDGDFIINSTGPVGKAMSQAILPLAAGAKKVVIVTDGEMKVMKRNGNGAAPAPARPRLDVAGAAVAAVGGLVAAPSAGPDVQDSFISDLESGVTGEKATGEQSSPTPGPSDPVAIPSKKRVPRIYQDAAAPPAPELAEAEMDRLLAEAQQAETEAARVAEDQRFQRQQAVQAQVEPSDVPAEQPAEAARPRRRERQLATTGRPCGRCGGGGKIVGDAGFEGSCPVCHGEGQVKTWDRSLKVR
jgi:hypothetical protein